MSYDIHRNIQREYEKRQDENILALKSRKKEIYSKLPQIEIIDDKIKRIGLEINKKILVNGIDNELIKKLTLEIESLKQNRKKILIDNNISENFLDIEYKCIACKDTGYIKLETLEYEKCICYKQRLINHIYEKSNLHSLKTQNFEFFDDSRFSEGKDEKKYGMNVSPKEQINNIKLVAKDFIEKFNTSDYKGILFTGPTGVGKTFMSNCIARDIMKNGRTVLYLSAPDLFNIIRKYRTSFNNELQAREEEYNYILSAELLIIDDLGIESITDSRYSEFLTIINSRTSKNNKKSCKTIISTNLGIKELTEKYTERIVSRIKGEFTIIKFIGDDLRTSK